RAYAGFSGFEWPMNSTGHLIGDLRFPPASPCSRLVSGLDSTKEPARSSVRGVEPQDLGKLLPGLGELALPGQGNAQVIMGHDIVGSELECGGIVTDGLGEAPLVSQGRPQVMMGFSVPGLEAEGFRILLNGLVQFPLSIEGIAQVIVHVRSCGLEL